MTKENIKTVVDLLNLAPEYDGRVIDQIHDRGRDPEMMPVNVRQAVGVFLGFDINDVEGSFIEIVSTVSNPRARDFWLAIFNSERSGGKVGMRIQSNAECCRNLRRIYGMAQ